MNSLITPLNLACLFPCFGNPPPKPKPTVKTTVLVYDGDVLPLSKVSRNEMGAYLCIATNGVPPSVSKRIILDVECKYSIQVEHGTWVAQLTGEWKLYQSVWVWGILWEGAYYISPLVGCLCQFSSNTRAHLPEREQAIHPARLSIHLSIHPAIPANWHPSSHPAFQPSNHPLSAFRAIFLHGAAQRLLFVPAAHQFNCTLVAPAMSDKRS